MGVRPCAHERRGCLLCFVLVVFFGGGGGGGGSASWFWQPGPGPSGRCQRAARRTRATSRVTEELEFWQLNPDQRRAAAAAGAAFAGAAGPMCCFARCFLCPCPAPAPRRCPHRQQSGASYACMAGSFSMIHSLRHSRSMFPLRLEFFVLLPLHSRRDSLARRCF